MKGVAIAALLLALGSVGAAGYGFVETKPNYDSFKADFEKHGPRTPYDAPLLEEYHVTLGRLCVAAWGAALLAIVFGVVAMKKRAKGMGIAAIVIALAGAGVAIAMMPQPLRL